MEKKIKTFPLKLEDRFNEIIDKSVFFTKAPTKHQYIIEAIREKVERDNEKHPEILKDEVM